MNPLVKLFFRLCGKLWQVDTEEYVRYMRHNGVEIGNNLTIIGMGGIGKYPRIDYQRPGLVEIGDDVYINENFKLFTHDYVSHVFLGMYGEYLPAVSPVKIGNNVGFGVNVTILRGVTIGDNCFIAANSTVTHDIPANSIAAGQPAKVICSIEDYYEKCRSRSIEESFKHARRMKEYLGRTPLPEELPDESIWYIDANNVEDYPQMHFFIKTLRNYDLWLKNHKAIFSSYEEFLKAAGVE